MILVKEAVKTLAIIVVEAHIKEDAQLAHLNVKESAKKLVGGACRYTGKCDECSDICKGSCHGSCYGSCQFSAKGRDTVKFKW